MKKIIALLLATTICLSCFVGCNSQPEIKPTDPPTQTTPSESPSEPSPTKPSKPSQTTSVLIPEFYAQFIGAMDEVHGKENYMVSPASLKMAFVLAAAGANGETLDKMLNAVGYDSLDEYMQWADNMNERAAQIAELKNINTFLPVNTPEYSIGYGIWHNIDAGGKILDSYIDFVTPLGATVDNLHGDDLMPEINKWIDNKTNGMIPQMFNRPLNNSSNVLVNTIYLKAFWENAFAEGGTKERDFTDTDGNVVQKESMVQVSENLHYIDDDTQIAILQLEHGFKMAIVLGDNTDVWNKIEQAKTENLNLQIPKFEIETSIEDELTQFLMSTDLNIAFTSDADFSKMTDADILIDTVIQKTKIEVKEDGLEAAAATAIIMKNDSIALEDVKKPVDFIADRPFTFYIYAESDLFDGPELLFYGQYVK